MIQHMRPAHLARLARSLSTTASVAGKPSTAAASTDVLVPEFPLSYPDFMQSTMVNRRIPLYEKLVRADMLERRLNLDIPEFYVGSIMAVTVADPNMASRQNRFLGICVRRMKEGLHHQFTLRNTVNGLGVEVMYDLYNPTIRKIETIKLERRLDDDLSYLIDALPEYSTFDFNMEPLSHPTGQAVPVNPLKVRLRPPPWSQRWEMLELEGIENAWEAATPRAKRKVRRTKCNDYFQYDLLWQYRNSPQSAQHQRVIEKEIRQFEVEKQKLGATRRRILRSAQTLV